MGGLRIRNNTGTAARCQQHTTIPWEIHMNRIHTALTLTAALALGACAPMAPGAGMQHSKDMQGMKSMGMHQQSMLPAAVQVPAGNHVAMETVGTGTIVYGCKAKKDDAMAYEWAFMGPDAQLTDRQGQRVGRYYGPPATWESTDGSKVTATQLAVAPAGMGNIPMQLVRANPAMGQGRELPGRLHLLARRPGGVFAGQPTVQPQLKRRPRAAAGQRACLSLPHAPAKTPAAGPALSLLQGALLPCWRFQGRAGQVQMPGYF